MLTCKRPQLLVWCFGLAMLLVSGPVLGQDLFIYPEKGQSQDQQNRDRYECHTWAVQQTGVDPTQAQAAAPSPPSSAEASQGGALRGAGRGAAIGAVGGAIGGKAGRGAAIGATTGALFGGMRRADQRQRQEQDRAQYQAQQQAAASQGRNSYNRAMSACLSGRGYTVK